MLDPSRNDIYESVYPNGNAGPVATPDLTKALRHTFVLNQNCYVAKPNLPTPIPPGSEIYLEFVQDGTGSRVITWDPAYRDAPAWGSAGPAGSSASGEFRLNTSGSIQFTGGSSAWAVAAQGLLTVAGLLSLQGVKPIVMPNPLPSPGAITIAGVAPTFTVNAIVSIAPPVGAIALAGVAPGVSNLMVPQAATLSLVGQAVTRSP
jgi:hypothetical protein